MAGSIRQRIQGASAGQPAPAELGAAPLIEIAALTKIYDLGEVRVEALKGVSFSVARGEFVAIMGSSGSGKSTLMNILGCLDRPTAGGYRLEGIDVSSLNEEELAAIRSRRIGFVFQSFNLLSRTSALENVELPLFYSAFTAGGEQRAHELLKMVGLAGREQSHPNQLSGGQQQRVAIARALVNDPAILLADEPTGNLDSKNSAEIMEFIRQLNREQGRTIIVVTHDPEVAAYVDRVITFRDGRIQSDQMNRGEPARTATVRPAPGASARDSAADEMRSEAEETWTFLAMAVSAAGRALRRNKMRSLLTMLGIFIGVAAVIAIVAIGNGARASVQASLQSLGTNLLIVLPGATTSNGVRAGLGSASDLTVEDANAIKKEDPAVGLVAYEDRQIAQVVNGDNNWTTNVKGVTPSYLSIRDWPVADGRPFTAAENKAAAPVCLLGQTVVKNLFGAGQDPIGATIRVKNFPLRVIGVLSPKGQSSWGQDQDDVVLIPFQTAQTKVLGVAAPVSAAAAASPTPTVEDPYAGVPTTNSVYANAVAAESPFGAPPKITGVVNIIDVQAKDAGSMTAAMGQIERTLHRRHDIQPGQDNDFTVRNLNDIVNAADSAASILTLFLAAVASISLLVGGIGIMNIMLVSVTERTREIGIRMAIGARRAHILLQFLVEALLLSVLGGIAGIILGVVCSGLISTFSKWPTQVSAAAIIGGFVFSALVGIFFGFYPARKASLLDPIEALRYE